MGQREKNRILIIKNYLKNNFYIDIIIVGSILIELTTLNGLWDLLYLVYLISIFKLGKIMTNLENIIVISDF